MKPEDVAAAVAEEADGLDLVVGPVVSDGKHVSFYLSAAHPSGRTAILETDGVERFTLSLDGFRWHEFEWDRKYQRQTLRELMALAASHLFGRTSQTSHMGRDGKVEPALEIHWQEETWLITAKVSRRIDSRNDEQ